MVDERDGGSSSSKREAAAIVADRENGIDAFRYLLIFTVILGHVWPMVSAVTPNSWWNLCYAPAHAAVPFFFIAAGYFLRPERGGIFDVAIWAMRKLAPVYVLWVLIYWVLLLPRIADVERFSFGQMLAGGMGYHLWFLPALGLGLAAVSVALRFASLRVVCAGAAALAVIGLLRGAYHNMLDLPGGSGRGAILVAPAFILIGVVVARTRPRRNWRLFGALALLCYVLQVSEDSFIIADVRFEPGQNINFTVMTFAFGTSMFLFARSLPSAALAGPARLGRLTFSIYCVHLLVIFYLTDWLPGQGVAHAVALSVATLAVSTALALAYRGMVRTIASSRSARRPARIRPHRAR